MTTDTKFTSETAMRGVKWLAEGMADHLLEQGGIRQGLVDAITVDPLWTKFAEAYQLENELTDYVGSDGGALGRVLDAFIANASQLVNGTT